MKKHFNKVFVILMIIITCSVMFFGCDNNKEISSPKSQNKILLSGFEDYYDIQKIEWEGFIGGVTLNSDEQYIAHGERSAKFHVYYDKEPPVDYNDNDGGKIFSDVIRPQMSFRTYLYDQALSDISNISAFAIDIYNANDRNIDIVFAIRDDGKNIVLTDGRTLEAQRWNRISFDIKSHFFGPSLGVSEYMLYMFDDEKDDADSMTLYFDECRVILGDSAVFSKDFEENEIVNFNSVKDNSYFLTHTQTETYPAFFASYTDRIIFGEQIGALMVKMRTGINWLYDVNLNNNGYKIEILSDIVKQNTEGALGVSIDCRNEGNGNIYVSLIVRSATKSISQKVLVPAKDQLRLTIHDLSGLDGEGVETITILIDNWNLVGSYNIYFRNLNVLR